MGDIIHAPLEVGAIHRMVTGLVQTLASDAPDTVVVVRGLMDVIDLPAELGGGTEEITGLATLPTCPMCGNVDDKPALILETLRLSECLACKQFIWYRPAA